MRHLLDAPRSRWLWLWTLPRDPMAEVEAWRASGVTGLVPQQGDAANAWAERWAVELFREGFGLVVGLGRISSAAIVRGLRGPAGAVMVNQEMWKSVDDSRRVVEAVLTVEPEAADRIVDCHYPCLVRDPETGKSTGHARIAKAWAPLCGLRAPQCYWSRGAGGRKDGAPDGWVSKRLAHARVEYPVAGGSPADRVAASVQMYRRSVRDHVALLLVEGERGSIWLWNWREADVSARVALRVVAELQSRGFVGATAVIEFQGAQGLVRDGLVGPLTCAALGVEVPAGVVWSLVGRS